MEPVDVHEVKLDPYYAADLLSGRKRFEIRRDDRDYKVGDILRISTNNAGTPLTIDCVIVYKLVPSDPHADGLAPGYCALGLGALLSVTMP